MGIQPLVTSSGSILKLLLFPSFCTSSRKIPLASLFHTCIYSPRTRGDNPWGHFCMEAERSYHFDHWLHVSKKYLCPLILCTFFHDFIYVCSLSRGRRQPIWGKSLIIIIMSLFYEDIIFSITTNLTVWSSMKYKNKIYILFTLCTL